MTFIQSLTKREAPKQCASPMFSVHKQEHGLPITTPALVYGWVLAVTDLYLTYVQVFLPVTCLSVSPVPHFFRQAP